jgi:hypothetical protein
MRLLDHERSREAVSSPTVWPYDIPHGSYHDVSRCECPNHCGYCFDDIRNIQITQPKRRYCSDYCRNRSARERALDRLLAGV